MTRVRWLWGLGATLLLFLLGHRVPPLLLAFECGACGPQSGESWAGTDVGSQAVCSWTIGSGEPRDLDSHQKLEEGFPVADKPQPTREKAPLVVPVFWTGLLPRVTRQAGRWPGVAVPTSHLLKMSWLARKALLPSPCHPLRKASPALLSKAPRPLASAVRHRACCPSGRPGCAWHRPGWCQELDDCSSLGALARDSLPRDKAFSLTEMKFKNENA